MPDTITYASAEALAKAPASTAGQAFGAEALLAAILSGSMADGTDVYPPSQIFGEDSTGAIGAILIDRVTKAAATMTTDHAKIHEGIAYTASGFLTLPTAKTASIRLSTPGPLTDTAATVTIDMTNANADLTYTAVTAGAQGNDYSVTHVVAGNDTPLSVALSGQEVIVNVATGPAGAPTSTAADIVAAIAAVPTVASAVTATAQGTGLGVVEAKTKTYLAGGTNNAYVHFKMAAVQSTAAVSVTLYEEATVTGTETAVEPRNCKRSAGDDSSVFVHTCVDATLGATTVQFGHALVPAASTGAVKIGGGVSAHEEKVLNPDSDYILGIANASGSTATIAFELFWYEESAA